MAQNQKEDVTVLVGAGAEVCVFFPQTEPPLTLVYTHTHSVPSCYMSQCSVCVCVSSLNNNPEKTMQRPPETLGCGKKRQHSHEHSGLN